MRMCRRHLLGMPLVAGMALAACAGGGSGPASDDGGHLPEPAVTQPSPGGTAPAPVAVGAGEEVSLTGTRSNAGWIVHFHIREPARTIWYRRPGDADWIETGAVYGAPNPTTGAATPKPYAVIPELTGTVPFAVRYLDASGAMKGPFEIPFDTVQHSVAFVRSVLGDVPTWIAFQQQGERRLVYFTTLLVYKYAMREIRFGFDDEPLRPLRFVPSDKLGISDGDQLFLDVPAGARACNVEVVFIDGSRSALRRFGI